MRSAIGTSVLGILSALAACGCDVLLPGEGAEGEPCLDGKRCEAGLICDAIEEKCVTATPENIGLQWAALPAGDFQMGSPAGTGEADERPQHQVTMDAFEMLVSEVTLEQYRACYGQGACTEPGPGCNWELSTRYDHPINCVGWFQARIFCEWVGGRLPCESEWEYAARSGGQDRTYPWGDDPPSGDCSLAVGSNCGGESCTWAVCSIPLGYTEQGLCDMAGNAAEWIQDWYHDTYDGAPEFGGSWEQPVTTERVVRGGSCVMGNPADLRTTERNRFDPMVKDEGIGFRCARDPD